SPRVSYAPYRDPFKKPLEYDTITRQASHVKPHSLRHRPPPLAHRPPSDTQPALPRTNDATTGTQQPSSRFFLFATGSFSGVLGQARPVAANTQPSHAAYLPCTARRRADML